MAMECVGSQLGAAAMGLARDGWGESGMFPVGVAALLLVLVPWALLRLGSPRTAVHESASEPLRQERSAA
jgi:hypothetical protein